MGRNENDAIPASNVITSDDNDSIESSESDGNEVIRATAMRVVKGVSSFPCSLMKLSLCSYVCNFEMFPGKFTPCKNCETLL